MAVQSLCPKTTATLIRTILRAAFPSTKFSVTTSRGSMCSSVSVRWTDGPTVSRVDSLVGVLESGSFNGMTDGFDYKRGADRIVIVGDVAYEVGCRYVQTSRNLSDAMRARAAAQVAAFYGVDVPSALDRNSRLDAAGEYWGTLIYQAASDRTLFAQTVGV